MERELIDLPVEMKNLPRDKRGYPVPEFVAWYNNEPDFRAIKPGYLMLCVKNNLCWLCGCKLGNRKWFVAGPMCTVTRTVSEPPSHRLCAEFAVKNCPFLTRPMAKRNADDLPEGYKPPPGIHLDRNPGCVAIWETRSYTVFKPQQGVPGFLFKMGDPEAVTYWREGRPATRDEVQESIGSGLPRLVNLAFEDGPEAVSELSEIVMDFRRNVLERFVPKGADDAAGVS